MSGIVTAISGQFGKALILGSLLPAVLFVVCSLILLHPFLPAETPVIGLLTSLDTAWQAAAFTLTAMVIGVVLYNLNTPIVRLYEGYTWMEWPLGRWLSGQKREELRRLQVQAHDLTEILFALQDRDPQDPRLAAIRDRRNVVQRALFVKFPDPLPLVLPTRLGNVIRSSETYPQRVYRISAIPVWIRLIANIDSRYADALDAAKSPFDFMINMSFLSIWFVVLAGGIALLFPQRLPDWQARSELLAAGVLALLSAWAFYTLSIGQAAAWGDMVRGAFDLYRLDLLKQLGYSNPPSGVGEERQLWGEISRIEEFGPSEFFPLPAYAATQARARGRHGGVPLEVGRSVDVPPPSESKQAVFPAPPPAGDKTVEVVLTVHNVDGDGFRAENVLLTETLPEGYVLVWKSARFDDGGVVEVSGANPYRFAIGAIGAGRTRIIRYRMTPVKAS